MRLRLDFTFALLLIIHSISSVSLQDPLEYGAGLNDGNDYYDAVVPTVGGNDIVGDSTNNDQQPLEEEENSDGLAQGSMVFSSAAEEDPQPTFPPEYLRDGEGEEPSGSSGTTSGSSETNGTIDIPEVRTDDYPGENETMEDENRPENTTVTTNTNTNTTQVPEAPLDPMVSPQNETVSTNSTNPTGETNSTSQANGTMTTETEVNSNTTEVTSPTPATNGSDIVPPQPTEGAPQDEGTTSTTAGVNDTNDGLAPVTESLPGDETTTTTATPGEIPIDDATTAEPTPGEIPIDDATTAEPEVPVEPTTSTEGLTGTAVGKAAGVGSGDSDERGLSSETENTKNNKAWGAVLGIAVAVGFVGLVVYVLLKRRGRRNFSHSKLVEDGHPDPVLRLDNGEPLDLKFDGQGYHNPTLEGDNIQMSNYPSGNFR
ncbi:mucin-15 [Engraulis encrasicolus]|uniref:mucin-15 n=1 Tax=Engraulis encrasicolus TaxID=184585 RepID=UPI002FD69A5E